MSRVNNHSRGLIYHHNVVVFVNYIERNIFGFYGIVVMRSIEQQRNHIARFHTVVAFYRLLINMHKTGFGCQLYAIARSSGQMNEKKFVDSQQLLPFVGNHSEMFVQLFVVIAIVFKDIVSLELFKKPIPPQFLHHVSPHQKSRPRRSSKHCRANLRRSYHRR